MRWSDSKWQRWGAWLAAAALAIAAAALAATAWQVQVAAGEAQARLEALEPQEREELARSLRRFDALDKEQQERVRRLHAMIEAQPDAEDLHDVARRYYDWLRQLPPHQRAELLDLPADERLQRVVEMQRAEAERRARHEGLSLWLETLAEELEGAVCERVPERIRHRIERSPDFRRGVAIDYVVATLHLRGPGRSPFLDGELVKRIRSEEELARLRGMLSPATQNMLRDKSIEEQWEQVSSWVREWSWQRIPWHRRFRIPVSDEDLAEFFENELSAEERDRLMRLDGERMYHELRLRYITSQRRPDPGRAPPRDAPWTGPDGGPPRPRREGADPEAGPPAPSPGPRPPGSRPGPGRGGPDGGEIPRRFF